MDWNIQKSTRQCAGCSRQLAEGDEHFSALFDRGTLFERQDFCPPCWQARDAAAVFSFWKTRIPTREEERKLLVDDSVLLDFFLRLTSEEGELPEHKVKFRYILALVLLRKKILKFIDILREDRREFLVLRYAKEKLDFRILDPGLTEEEADTVKDDLAQILNVEV